MHTRQVAGTVMHELSTELGRFIGGGMSLDQLRAVFRTYLAQHQDQRELISRWLRNTVEEGRLSANVWLSLRDLFETASAPSLTSSLAAAIETPQAESDATPIHAAAPAAVSRRPATKTQLASSGMVAGATAMAPKGFTGVERRARPKVEQRAPGSSDTVRVGTVVRERFVLVEQLGAGGMGQVYKARDLRREEAQDRQPFIALKVLNKEVSAHPDSFIALQREARRASTLAHPNVVTVYDFDRDGQRIYMTMEYLEGRGLDALMRDDAYSKGMPLDKAWPIIRGIAMALEYGHQKRIVHCDLKPGNVFICNDGTVKVLDFGIARLIRPTDTKSDQTLFDPAVRLRGLTPAYASLEMWNCDSPDPRDDIYALACVTYELLSGQHPFEKRSAKVAVERNLTPRRIENLSRAQWESVRKGLALRREDRTRSVGELIKEFAPKSRVRKYALPGAVLAVLATAAALAVSARYYRDVVEDSTLEVLQCAQIPKPAPTQAEHPVVAPTPEQQQEIQEDILLAREFLRDATRAASIDDLKYILSEGTNSVNDILDIVLRMDPSHAEALQLKASVADLYAARARTLLEKKQVAEALDLVRYGRKVLPASQELFRLEQKVCRADTAARFR
jgi:serine/threonine protein kinase